LEKTIHRLLVDGEVKRGGLDFSEGWLFDFGHDEKTPSLINGVTSRTAFPQLLIRALEPRQTRENQAVRPKV
jgi:hypothetical protein